jgi:hypothetical protein
MYHAVEPVKVSSTAWHSQPSIRLLDRTQHTAHTYDTQQGQGARLSDHDHSQHAFR